MNLRPKITSFKAVFFVGLFFSIFSATAQKTDNSLVQKKDSAKGIAAVNTIENKETKTALNLDSAYDQLINRLSVLTSSRDSFAVQFGPDTVFYLYEGFGPYKPKERVKKINNRLASLKKLPTLNVDSIYVDTLDQLLEVRYKSNFLFSLSKADAVHLSKSLNSTSFFYVKKLKNAFNANTNQFDLVDLLIKLGLLLIVITVFVLLIKLINRGFVLLNQKVEGDWREKYIRGIKYNNIEFLTDDTTVKGTLLIAKLLRILILLVVVYISLPAVFYIFPATKSIAKTLFEYILAPIKSIFFGFVNYVPSAIAIVVIVLVTRYVIRFLKYLSLQIEREEITLPGFYSDWAKPTFNIIRFVIYAFMFVVIFPYLPGSNSPVFQGVSVFLGLVISLGSTSAIGNLVAGLVITYMRPFRIGDRVKIGDIVGDVIEKSMLVSRVRTLKNEEVTIPNASILSGHTVNYSTSAKDFGIAVYTDITIGYDVHWKKVHELLLNAASKTAGIQKEPPPFVLQTSLDDFYVSYQINGYTRDSAGAVRIKSEMIQHIQDNFNEAEIEILSPHYRANRADSQTTVIKPNKP